jgi:hypothetical protein
MLEKQGQCNNHCANYEIDQRLQIKSSSEHNQTARIISVQQYG